MKKMLVVFWLFSISAHALGQEQRQNTFHPYNEAPVWREATSTFPQVDKGIQRGGTLAQTRIKAIDNLSPFRGSSPLIDDLYFESLMLLDPVSATENLYPLLASGLRIADDESYVVFELDPRARFQDGSFVTGRDVMYSVEELKKSNPAQKTKIEDLVRAIGASANEIRFDLKTTGQASRRAIAFLAQLKIVKPNVTGASEVGGIPVKYTATGPYRLTQLGRSRLSLIVDPAYWGKDLSTRKGFFNFRVVEVLTYPDETSARMSVVNETANFFVENQPGTSAGAGQLLKKSGIAVQAQETATHHRIPALSFNLKSPAVADWRIRQALLLAYDFEGMNRIHFGGSLQRPTSLLAGSDFAPKGAPSAEVRALMETCGTPDLGDFESHGHAQYAALADKRIRLLTSMRLLQESGYRLENGVLKRPLPAGGSVPVQVRILVRESEARSAYLYRADLLRMGILAVITVADGENYRGLRQSSDFDLVPGEEGFLNKEGFPSPEKLNLADSHRLPCLQKMISVLEAENPRTQSYRDNSEAIARVHQALHLSIFTGAPAAKNFFFDSRLTVPAGLSAEGIHMYGYWIEHESAPPSFYSGFGHAWDLGTLLGGIGHR